MTGVKNYISLIDSIKSLDKTISVRQTSKPLLSSTIITSEFVDPKVIDSFICTKNDIDINLCAIEYDHIMPYTRQVSVIPAVDRSVYWIGIIKTKNYYPHTFIRPEKLIDKLVNLFTLVDIKVPYKESFNSKYYVASDKTVKLISSLSDSIIDYLTELENITLELKGNTCIYRLDNKPINEAQTKKYIDIGFRLTKKMQSGL